MFYLKKRNIALRKVWLKKEVDYTIYKTLWLETRLSFSSRLLIYKWMRLLKNINLIVKIKNRCSITNRSKSVNRFFSVSRLQIKKLIRIGFLCGIKQSSW